MTLNALSTTHLRAIAGYSYERGERYWRQGRVQSYEVEGKTISGVVQGTRAYAVRVFEHGRGVHADCTCPMGGVNEMCKHAVALALHHLAQGSGPARPARPTRFGSTAFASRAELDAWVEEHHVRHELDVSAAVIAPDVQAPEHVRRNLTYQLHRWPLREIATLDAAIRPADRDVGIDIAEAARRYLERAAKDVAEARREEREARSPSEASLQPLWARLRELRGELRKHAAPRSRAFRAAGKLELEAADHVLWWREPTRITLTPYGVEDVHTQLTLVPATGFICRCGRPVCVHGLALVDAALDVLSDPSRVALARSLAECLLRPTWERALNELAEARTKPTTAIEVWWLIGESYGELTLVPLVKKPRKKGGMTAGAKTSARRLLEDHKWGLDERDIIIAEQLATAADMLQTRPVRAFRALVGHPRVALADASERPIEVVRAPLGFVASPKGDRVELVATAGSLALEPERLEELLDDKHVTDTVVVTEPNRCVVVDIARDALRTWNVLRRHGREFPAESHARLLDHLADLARTVPVDVPESLLGTRIVEQASVVLRLRLEPNATLEIEALVSAAAGAPPFPPGVGPRDVLFTRAGARVHTRRHLASESELVRTALAQLLIGDVAPSPDGRIRIEDADRALGLVAAVSGPVPGVSAEWIDDRRPIVKSAGAAQLGVTVTRKRDWFGIEGELEIDGERVELAVVLDAVRNQRRFVRLDDHRWVELSDLLKRRLAAVAERTFRTRGDLELSPGAIVAIRELEAEGARVQTPPAWQLLAERLAAAEKLRPRPPAALHAELRPYQVEGHAWLTKVAAWGAGACLADDMGLGKTVQAIAVLLDRARTGPALVLAPTSVTLNWVDELRRFAPSLRPIVYAEDRGCLGKLTKKDVVIASYGLLVRDAEQLAGVEFATLVADEAQALKNAATRRAKAARALKAEFRIALSGTPFENRLAELWSLFAVVFPGLLGSWEQFRERFATPIERDGNPEARAALSRVIRPFLLRRTKHEVARELPARTEIDVPVALSAEETELYEDARIATLAKLGRVGKGADERQRIEVLAALTKLRLLASHPRLYDAESAVASSKLQRFLDLLEELRSEGHRALVFSQFTKHLALVRAELDRLGYTSLYLDGSTPAADRADLIRRFQGGEGEVFLLSLKAGGTGINLTAADYVIHLDPWWNPAVEDQATDRAHRIGQTKPVTVYRLIARGTVEEQILSLHADKRALVADVLDGTDAAGRLTTRDLLALIGGG